MAQIIVIDLGSQLSHLIARRVRELGVYSEVIGSDVSSGEIAQMADGDLKGIIISGGPASIYEDGAPGIDRNILGLGVPVLGICYGHQLIAHYAGGEVARSKNKEYGTTILSISRRKGISALFSGIKERLLKVWMNHGDIVKSLPDGFSITASTENSPVAAFENTEKRLFGVQFHLEVTHTESGSQIISNFIFRICMVEKDWSMKGFASSGVELIKTQLGQRNAIIGLSGGVDSSVCAALASKAIGKRLTALFIDTGLMRAGEADEIREAFGSWLELRIINAGEEFFSKLKGVADPELKRKIIGETFIRVFERESGKLDAGVLIQGTIYPDVIESGSTKHSSTIKTHHNVGGLPEKLNLELCEPLRELYKDEVRELGRELGLPEALINRHPFPGPGLAIRVIGECTPENIETVRKADQILNQELAKAGFYSRTWQAFCVLLPVRSVGVQGDARAYKKVVAVRMVDSVDAMTVNFTRAPYGLLECISTRITNEIGEIGRVVYDITNKPPGTIEWE